MSNFDVSNLFIAVKFPRVPSRGLGACLMLDANLIGFLNWGTELVKLGLKAWLFANATSDSLIHLAMAL